MSIPVSRSARCRTALLRMAVHGAVVAVLAGGSAVVVAAPVQQSPDKPKVHRLEPKKKKEARDAVRPKVDPVIREMMEGSKPSKEHEALQVLVGTWSAKGRVFPGPEADPWPIEGTMVSAMILGDRYLQSEWQGSLQKQKFWGRGLDGYDKIKQKHFSQWIDSMNTGLAVFEGTASADGRIRTMYSDGVDPATGNPVKQKAVTRVRGYNSYSYESFVVDGEGNEVKTMEILFTREAAAGDGKRREGSK